MRLVEIIRKPDYRERQTLVDFIAAMTDELGARPLSDHLWLDLQAGGAVGFIAVRIAEADRTLAIAQISAGNDTSSLELVVRSNFSDARQVYDDAFDTAIDCFRRRGGGPLQWWVDNPTADDVTIAARHLMAPDRRLHEMRHDLPIGEHASVETRSFVPGADDDAWLTVNNRAFATHGEQGGWTNETLALRLAEPWFDADGFRLHERHGRLAAFCWTKIHYDHDPSIGEIYVIAVDPEFHGQGLGRQLTLAGLDSIADRGVTDAMLYVDADNVAAVALYTRMGFTIQRTRQAFSAVLSAIL